jgi:hypothetical protein
MTHWEERERRRFEVLSRIVAAEASLSNGQGMAMTPDAMARLAHDVKHRGRARLAAKAGAPR